MASAFSGVSHGFTNLFGSAGNRGRYANPIYTERETTNRLDESLLPPVDTSARDAQARADAEQAAKNAASARINKIFGYQPEGAVDPVGSAAAGGLRRLPVGEAPATPAAANTWDSEAAANMAARTKSYADIAKAVQDYHQHPLDEQTAEAQRQTNFSLLRRGLGGGSEELHQGNILDRARTAAMENIANIGTGASNAAKSSDEASRLDILSRINAGLDATSAAQSALAELGTSGVNALASAKGQVLSDPFKTAGLLYNQDQLNQGALNPMSLGPQQLALLQQYMGGPSGIFARGSGLNYSGGR